MPCLHLVLACAVLIGACTHASTTTRAFLEAPGDTGLVRVEFRGEATKAEVGGHAAVIRRHGPSFVEWRDGSDKPSCYQGILSEDDLFPVFDEIARLDPHNAEALPEREREPEEDDLTLTLFNARDECFRVSLFGKDEHTTAWGNNVVQRVEWLVVKLTAKANEIACAGGELAEAPSCPTRPAPAVAGAAVLNY
jgi:hypothetical protein